MGLSMESIKGKSRQFETKPFSAKNYGDCLMDKNWGSSYFVIGEAYESDHRTAPLWPVRR
jgi:hypothetical protein